MSNDVSVSRPVLATLVATSILSLMAVSFLLGRQSISPSPQPVVVQVTPGPESPVTGTLHPAPPPQPAALPVAAAVTPALAGPAPAPAPATAPPPAPAPPPPPQARVVATAPVAPAPAPSEPSETHPKAPSPELRVYFQKVDEAVKDSSNLGDANQFATEILQRSLNGDSSGFDRLLANTEKAQAALKAIHPPEACKEHFRLLQRQLEASENLLRKVKAATVSMDTSALSALSSEGHAMEEEAKKFQELERKLRAGL